MEKKEYTMKEMPVSEKPYEKCIRYGASVLSDAELLAIIIKTGTRERTSLSLAMDILKMNSAYPGLMGLHHVTMQELTKLKGIGRVKAVQLLCVAEITKRMWRLQKDRSRFCRPSELAGYFMEEMRNLEQEHLYAVLLDASGRLLHYRSLFVGTNRESVANPREILRLALRYDAAHYVILHNHPSGDPVPSDEDVHMTRQLMEASKLIGIPLEDHIIIGDREYISLREMGYLS